jgi:gas vesicle protein
MTGPEAAEKLSKKYSMTMDDFIKTGTSSMLMEKKREFQSERLEILSRYGITTVEQLKEKIKKGEIQEHPGWEDLIELKNIEAEIKEIESDIRDLQTA